MIFSSYYDNDELKMWLPGTGSIVTLQDCRRPLQVIRRIRKDGTVLVALPEVGWQPIEVVEWWPQLGDHVDIAMGPYLDWQAVQQGKDRDAISLPQAVMHTCKVRQLKGDIAIVVPQMESNKAQALITPITALRVLTRMGVRVSDVERNRAQLQPILSPEKQRPNDQAVAAVDAAQQSLLDALGL